MEQNEGSEGDKLDSSNKIKKKNLFSSTASNNQIREGIQSYDTKKYKNYQFLIDDYKSKYEWLK